MSKDTEQALPGISGSSSGSESKLIPKLLWISLIAWIIRVTIFVRQRSSSEFSSIDFYAIIQIGIVLFILGQIVLSRRFRPIWSSISKTSIKTFIAYYLLCVISALWSPMQIFSFYRAFEFMILLMAVLIALSYCSNFSDAERKILFISVIVILLTMYVETRATAFKQTLAAWHNNSFTSIAAMLFIYCLGEYFGNEKKRRKKRLKRYGAFSLFALILGTSSASFIAAICGIIFLTFIKKNLKLFVISCVVLGILILLDFDILVARKLIFYGKSDLHISSIDGRLIMWEQYFHYAMLHPILGNGFAVVKFQTGRIISSDPHNSFFSIILGTGAVGLAVVIVYIFRLLKEIFRSIQNNVRGACGCGCAIITGLINSLSMSFVFDEWEEASLVFVNISALFILFVYNTFRKNLNK